ncbi:MAG: glycerophosphodiester phosphodiesterase [Actinobacteria bacterium]|nr:glycerophosphodiester phosphodiesterase [Actinomycetota bacterium]
MTSSKAHTDIIGHRGASTAFRENTIEAFVGAFDMGADCVEFDVRFSLDKALVVHHDPHLADGRNICDTAVADLPAHVPTVEQVLDAAASHAVNIEIKNGEHQVGFDPARRLADAVVAVIQRREIQHAVLVSSFDLPMVDRILNLDPNIATALLVARGDAQALIELCRARGHRTINPATWLVDDEFMSIAKLHDLRVNVWTEDDPDRIRQLAHMGVDGIVTNVPDVAIKALAAM